MAEKTDASGGAPNPNPEKGGGDEDALLEKVGALIEEHTGIKLSEVIARHEATAAAKAAAEAGQKAQKTYDPKLSTMEASLKRLQDENREAKRKLREVQIAALPEAARDAAKKLAELEDAHEDTEARTWRANEALKVAHAKELALDLKERGIKDVSYQDFLEFDSPEGMDAKHAEIRADHAERRLQEVEQGSTSKEPPASSTTPSRGKGGASGAGGAAGSNAKTGDKPWQDYEKKGLSEENLGRALVRMHEEDYRGER